MTEKALLSEKVMFRLTEVEYQKLLERASRQERSLSNLARVIITRALHEPEDHMMDWSNERATEHNGR